MTQFTPLEAEMLIHRLDVPDALAECFADDLEDDDEGPVDRAVFDRMVDDRCAVMRRNLSADRSIDVTALDQLGRDILKDAVEGSTWVYSYIEPGRRLAPPHIVRAARSAAQKLRDAGLDLANAPE